MRADLLQRRVWGSDERESLELFEQFIERVRVRLAVEKKPGAESGFEELPYIEVYSHLLWYRLRHRIDFPRRSSVVTPTDFGKSRAARRPSSPIEFPDRSR